MDITALLLADSRFPGGGHAHSGGLEEAAARGLVSTEDDLPGFLLGRLHTAGTLAAVFAAAAAHAARRRAHPLFWSRLDAELDARTPTAAQRAASRAQGSGLLRVLKVAFSNQDWLKVAFSNHPHHPIALGAAVGSCGGLPIDAALAAAYVSVSGPASAAVRLLGLDPLVVNAALMALADPIRAVAERAEATAALDPSELPAPGAPALDLFAEAHSRKQVKLFAS